MSETTGTRHAISEGTEGKAVSRDGTAIAYTRWGAGEPLIMVDGALCSRGFGPALKLAPLLAPHFTVYAYDRRGRGGSGDTAPYGPEREIEDLAAVIEAAGGSALVYGMSSGAALALAAAASGAVAPPGITRLALYEAPFIVDGGHAPLPAGFGARLQDMVASGRRGDAVKAFMRFAGTPGAAVAIMPLTPMWPKLKRVAHTLPYDIAIVAGHQRGEPLDPAEFARVTVPTLVLAGGRSPAWMTNGMRSLADVLPNARHVVLPGQTHMVKPQALAPALIDFLS